MGRALLLRNLSVCGKLHTNLFYSYLFLFIFYFPVIPYLINLHAIWVFIAPVIRSYLSSLYITFKMLNKNYQYDLFLVSGLMSDIFI